ncbi:MAG: response regulator transcription factor [Verrucomicrobiales bacterium]|jgi:DNA-binding response OmpR family regulator|nr:response regulator transcription factor [Verrucomicrobiales bacterium]
MKILVAEDDPVTRESIEVALTREGFNVFAVENGVQAVAAWKAKKPDLVCLDIMMPEQDGFSVCKEIRSKDNETPILFLSAKNEEIDVVVGLELGADDFIRKPFGKRELIARIRGALRRSKGSAAERKSFEMGDWVVFPRELRAERDNSDIELTPREVSILALLSRRMGEVVSRDDILNECWGIDYYPESRTLDQHISKLRKKLGDDPDAPDLLETVRGVGYRYRGPKTGSR